MSELLKRISTATSKFEELKTEKERMQGRFDAEMDKLTEENFNSLEEVESFLAEEEVAVDKIEKDLEQRMEDFELENAKYLE